MVNGIESFARKFEAYTDCYTVIGGAACDILMSEADTEFRATTDIDMILIMEARYKELPKYSGNTFMKAVTALAGETAIKSISTGLLNPRLDILT